MCSTECFEETIVHFVYNKHSGHNFWFDKEEERPELAPYGFNCTDAVASVSNSERLSASNVLGSSPLYSNTDLICN